MRAALALALVLLAVAPALAEPAGPPAPGDVALGFRFDESALRLNGWFLTADGFWGFWLDGARRDRGLTVQGRVQRDGRALNFSLDAQPEAGGTLRWWQDPL
ncbi:MAG: hypothetical protein ACRELS_19170 [Candidatus Rokuibacteriota bacterium]